MAEYTIEAMIQVQGKITEASKEVISLLESGKPVSVIVEEYTEEAEGKRRTTAMNRLIYKLYQRIGKTLYGGDESHARNECKLRIGCRILYRDSKEFAKTFDSCIRPMTQENRLNAMNLISVSSIMKVKQGTEYIKTIMTEYGQQGCYFLDIENAEDYLKFPESQK